MTITQFTFNGKERGTENKEYSAEVSAEMCNENSVRVTYSITEGNQTEQFPIEFDVKQGTMNLSNLAVTLSPYVRCVITCGLGHLATEILECWRKGNRKPSDLVRCLRGKGHSIASGLSNCAISCLSSIGGGTP